MDVQVAGQYISPEEVTAQSGWLTAGSHRSKRGTDNSTPTDASSQVPSNRPRSRARQPVNAQVLKAGRMPPLPTEDIKIVIRPKGTLHIAKISSRVVTAAILQAAKLTTEESLKETVCPNTQHNFVVGSTPHSDHVDRSATAPRYSHVRYIRSKLTFDISVAASDTIWTFVATQTTRYAGAAVPRRLEVRDFKQSQTPAATPIAQNAPAPSQEAPTTPAPKKRALQDGATGQVRAEVKDMLISLQTTMSTFQHALDSIQHTLIGIVQRVTNLDNHILTPPSHCAPVCDPSVTPMATSTITVDDNTVDEQLHRPSTWKLLKRRLDCTTTRTAQQDQLQKLLYTETLKQRVLDYLCTRYITRGQVSPHRN
ncbi:hypothetical protein HPB49_010595 [Dermacentor silvarum]|uniref:Uncharacterized protein n=1 Tax=Dermacentor silvarum TaxID=543639 RepID=A0ACB8DIM7_DERSI|nr:hypothetical protein HPB49_010595 [Dermacentor silvarum]